MNQTQRRYAIERVIEIYRIKVKQIENSPNKDIPPNTREALLALIKAGKVKVAHPYKKVEKYTYVSDVFELPKGWLGKDTHDASIKKRKETATKELNRVKDQIMLGDAEVGLVLIKAFEKMKF